MGDQLTVPDVGLRSGWLAQNDASPATVSSDASPVVTSPARRPRAEANPTGRQGAFQLSTRMSFLMGGTAVLGVPLAYFSEYFMGHDVGVLPGVRTSSNGPLTLGIRIAADATVTGLYTLAEPSLPEAAALPLDLSYGIVSAFGCAGAVGEFPNIANRNLCISGLSNIASARAYRHGGQMVGSISEFGLALGLGIAGLVVGSPDVPEGPRAATDPQPPTYAAQTVQRDLLLYAGIHGANAIAHFVVNLLTRNNSPANHSGRNLGFGFVGGNGYNGAIFSGSF